MIINKKIIGIIILIIICVSSLFFPNIFNNKVPSQPETLGTEIVLNDENSFSEEEIKKYREEHQKEIYNWNLALEIATDIYKSVLADEFNLDSVYFNNLGKTNIKDKEYYTISLTNEKEETLKILGIDLINKEFVYLNDKKTETIQKYQYIGNFVNSMSSPWHLETNNIVIEENNQYERYGTLAYLYRENGTLKLSISTYHGFANIAQIIVEPQLVDENTLSFSFEDDKFGNSGSGTIKYVSNKELTLEMQGTRKSDYGIFIGTGKLLKATS